MSAMFQCQKFISAILLLHVSVIFQDVNCQPVQHKSSQREAPSKYDETALSSQLHESLSQLQTVSSIQDILQRHAGTRQLANFLQVKSPRTLSAFDIQDYLSHGRQPEENLRSSLKGRVLDEEQVLRMLASTAGRPVGVGPPFGFYDARLLQPILSSGGKRLTIQETLHGNPHFNTNYGRHIEIKEPSARTPSFIQETKTTQPLAGVSGSIQEGISKGLLRYVNVPRSHPVHETSAEQLLPLIVPQEVQMIQALQTLASLQMVQHLQHHLQAAAASQAKARGIKFEYQQPGLDPYSALLLGAIRRNGGVGD